MTRCPFPTTTIAITTAIPANKLGPPTARIKNTDPSPRNPRSANNGAQTSPDLPILYSCLDDFHDIIQFQLGLNRSMTTESRSDGKTVRIYNRILTERNGHGKIDTTVGADIAVFRKVLFGTICTVGIGGIGIGGFGRNAAPGSEETDESTPRDETADDSFFNSGCGDFKAGSADEDFAHFGVEAGSFGDGTSAVCYGYVGTKWNRRNSRRTRNSIRQTNIPILIPRTPMPLLLFPITTIPLRNWRRRHQTPCPNPVLLHRRLQNLKMPPSLQNVQDLTIPIRRLPQWQPAIEIDPVNSQSDRFGPRPFIFISIRDASSIGFLVGHGIIRTSITTVMFLLLMVIRPLE
mmetsp:Transcript_28493/g.56899  ORF Transcript_28493/g.56899 Transcript_28493/m.56899 type:complete len:348 (+) Transcript_28493:264-1307(+)